MEPVAITRTRLIALIAIMRIRLIATAKEEVIAAIQEDYIVTGDGQEGERGVDERNVSGKALPFSLQKYSV